MEFKDPPTENVKAHAYWREVVDELERNPGKWAFVGRWACGTAARIREGRYKAFIAPDVPLEGRKAHVAARWEIYAPNSDGKRTDMWIRRRHGATE